MNTALLTDSPLFEKYTHPDSGVVSYILTRRVAPVQQGFYFVNNGWSDSGRYLWFYTAFPPAGTGEFGRTLGVIDFEKQTVTHHPECQFDHAAPWVDPDTGEVYWMQQRYLRMRGPTPDASTRQINAIPEEMIAFRHVHRGCTHLTRRVDGKTFFVDPMIGLGIHMGELPIDGGDFQTWHRFDRNFNHTQFSPTDPNRVLISMEFHRDQVTGHLLPVTDRMWLMRRGQAPQPACKTPAAVTHEWWDDDGENLWCIQIAGPEAGTWRVNIATGEKQIIWPGDAAWHSHHHPSKRYLVGDRFTPPFHRGCRSLVAFYNIDTGRSVRFVDNPARNDYAGRNYHIDPHPRFCCDGRFIVHTTTVRGQIDLAITPVEPLIDMTV